MLEMTDGGWCDV